jgi:hypothetical protein
MSNSVSRRLHGGGALALALGLILTAPGHAAADQHETMVEAAGPESVARALFTREIVDREPGKALTHAPSDVGTLYFFTELTDLEGETVVHRWEWNDQVMAEVAFDVRGPRWRVWSSKKIEPEWLGSWTVTVVDGSGSVLASRSLTMAESAGSDAADAPMPQRAPMPREGPTPAEPPEEEM